METPVPLPDKYEALRWLGRGATSEVFLARDRRLDRLVAIKLLEGRAGEQLARFRREARLTARLDDPAIVRVYELEEHGERPYIAMEYVEGGNLAEAELDLPRVLQVGREVALALEHAHAAGIVHRDVKPENILLDRAGRPRITDFGLARDLGACCDARVSQDGAVIGTPTCMSPEQAAGGLAVDERSDVYSLGATLYTLIAGRPPFVGRTVVDVLHAVLHDPPTPLCRFAPGVPAEVEMLVHRCLAKEPERRFATMRELRETLERVAARLRARPGRGPLRRLLSRLVTGSEPRRNGR